MQQVSEMSTHMANGFDVMKRAIEWLAKQHETTADKIDVLQEVTGVDFDQIATKGLV